MASRSNVPKEVLDSIRDSLDRRIKFSVKRLVKYEVRPERWENRVVAFSNNRLFVFTAKNPTKIENKFHYLDLHAIESPKPNKLVLTFGEKSYSFTTLEGNTDEVDHMITHMCTSVKTVFPTISIERIIKKIDVQPSDRLRLMHDMVNSIEQKETGPCGGFTLMYDCMCEYHELPFRDEVSWDVDTIYLSQDSKELCLRDFDHLHPRDLVPIVSALLYNPWFKVLNANNVRLSPEVCSEILHVVQKNSVLESLELSNTGISNDFLQKLSTSILSMSGTQLRKLDLSSNLMLDDKGIIHLIGSLSRLSGGITYLDLSKTKLSSKGIKSVGETMSKNSFVFSSLQTLKLAELSSGKAEDLQMLYSFLAQPSMISHLDLSGTDCELEKLMAPLQRGCSQTITYLKLSRTAFTYKRVREIVVPASFNQFFSTVYLLKTLNLSGCKIPPEALKELLSGLGSNRNLSNMELNLSSVELPSQGIQHLQNSLSQLTNITSLNISNIVFSDQDLSAVLNSIGQNKTIKYLSIGRVFQKVKNMNMIMEELVHVIQDEESVIESLSLADSRLKSNMNQIINALGSNTSLTELDISGNAMGDLGARMLSKALQINNKLKTIMWDRNNTTAQGFEDIADALEKNYTLRKMPVPIFDASQAARAQPERTEAALQAIERLLQRNHSPQKYSSDQAYRLQQGFLISSTQQMIDRLVVQSQDTINALNIDPQDSYSNDIKSAKALIQDADNSKMLLPKLHDLANESQNPGNPVEAKIKQIAEDLKMVLETQMKKTVEQMLESTKEQCKAIMGDEVFVSALQAGCNKNSMFPKDFTTNILAAVDNEIFNKLSELNLAVAAHVSDRILDEVIDRLSKSHKTLTNHLNIKKKNETRSSKIKSDRLSLDTTDDGRTSRTRSNSPQASPKVEAKRKSMLNRKLRPQSVIDRDRVAVNNDAGRPLTVPQTKRSPRLGSRSPKLKKSGPKQPVPNIEITYANVSRVIGLKSEEPIYDNAKNAIYMNVGKPGEVYRPEHEEAQDSTDDYREPDVKANKSVSVKPRKTGDDVLGELPTLNVESQKLTHLTTSRPKVDRTKKANRTRPTTRKSQLPGTNEVLDEGLDDFFVSKADDLSFTPVTKVTPDGKKTVKTDSNKTEPDSKKKHGLFGLGHSKDKEHKAGGLLSKFKKSGKTKENAKTPNARKLSQVGEEQVDGKDAEESVSQKSSDETSSQKSLQEKRRSNQSANSIERSLPGSEADSSSLKSQDSEHSGSVKDNKSETLEENGLEEKEEQTESGTEEGTTEEELDEEGEQSQEEIIEEKKEIQEETVKEKKPLELPKFKRSFEKTSEKKNEVVHNSDKSDEDSIKSEEDRDKDDKEKEKDTESIEDKEKETDIKTTDEREDQEKKSEEEEKKEEQPSPRLPAGVPKMLGGLGGTNMMAELKAKQEKRKSMLPSVPNRPDTSPKASAEEKQLPFGGINLKSVGDRRSKEKTDSDRKSKESLNSEGENKDTEVTTVRPSSVKQNEQTKEEKPGSTPERRPSAPEPSAHPGGEKPLKPTAATKPIIPMRPKPPPVGNKPKPAPRKSRLSDTDETVEDVDEAGNKTKIDEKKDTVESSTTRVSVKEEIEKLRKSGEQSDLAKQIRPPSKTDSSQGTSSPKLKSAEEKEESIKRESKSGGAKMPEGEEKPVKPSDVKKEDLNEEAGVLDNSTEDNKDMTDSGIIYNSDTLKLSVKDKASKFGGKEESSDSKATPKSSSLTRGTKSSDTKDTETPKRPRSMLAVLENNPGLKKSDDKKDTVPKDKEEAKDNEEAKDKEEAKEPESPTDQVVMV